MTEMRSKDQHIEVLKHQILRLEKQNADLHDRFMSMNFEKFKTYQEPSEIFLTESEPKAVFDDETSAGMVLSDEIESEESR